MKIKKTREAILDAAIHVFNEKRASNSSTVQIANYMEISPGNLYYYFNNKEEIIRCIWRERIVKDRYIDSRYYMKLTSGRDIVASFDEIIQHVKKYQFFYTELSTLLFNDPELAEDFNEYKASNMRAVYHIVTSLEEEGLIRTMSRDDKIYFSRDIWNTVTRMLFGSYAYVLTPSETTLLDHMFLVNMVTTLKPYATGTTWEEMQYELARREVEYSKTRDLLCRQFTGE